jgi:hypothetical protein
LPSGAEQLAKSVACKNQAFQMGNNVIALQFHLETTLQSAKEIVVHCRGELIEGKYIHTELEILAVPLECYDDINMLKESILAYLQASIVEF